MSGLSTHVLDTSTGRPAAGVAVRLERRTRDGWQAVNSAETDRDGRVGSLLDDGEPLNAATYRLTFDTGAYFARSGDVSFYPTASVVFEVRAPDEHHHVPLLLSPFGYSTYRGS